MNTVFLLFLLFMSNRIGFAPHIEGFCQPHRVCTAHRRLLALAASCLRGDKNVLPKALLCLEAVEQLPLPRGVRNIVGGS